MKTEEYYADLLVGAEVWAIDQIREEFKKLEEANRDIKLLVGQLIDILEQEETSDSGTDFHPTILRSCRVEHTIKLNEIMPKITQLVRVK